MKKLNSILIFILFSAFAFVSCDNNSPEDPFPSELTRGCYVINFGNYGKGGASISKFDYLTGTMFNFYNEQQNGGSEFLSNIQYAFEYKDSLYLIGNMPDQLITTNPLLVQSRNGLTDKMANPRYCVAAGDYLYISCWGQNPDYDEMPGSYIAKYKIGSNTVEKTFDLPGGPEGMAVSNNKLYVALNYKDSIAVIDIKTENISFIATPAVSSYFQIDNAGNLYVALVSTYADFSTETGLGYINVKTDKLETVYPLDNVSSNYGSVVAANNDLSKIYVVTSAYDANWNLTGAIAEFNTSTKSFSSTNPVSNISGISGVVVNPENNNLYVLSAQSATGAGQMQVFNTSGTLLTTHQVGAYPVGAFFLE